MVVVAFLPLKNVHYLGGSVFKCIESHVCHNFAVKDRIAAGFQNTTFCMLYCIIGSCLKSLKTAVFSPKCRGKWFNRAVSFSLRKWKFQRII